MIKTVVEAVSPSKTICVLISGNGSNLQAIIDGVNAQFINAQISCVISNKPDVYGLIRAQKAGIKTAVVEAAKGENREHYDQRLAQLLNEINPDCIVLAGFMRILTESFTLEFGEKMLNVHPSLLPKYKGLHTHQRAIEAGDSEHGCSIHFVTPELDGGPVILQARVPIFSDDSPEDLALRVQSQERQIYPLVIKWFCENRLRMVNNRAVLDGNELPEDGYAA